MRKNRNESLRLALAENMLKRMQDLIKANRCKFIEREIDGKDFETQLIELGFFDIEEVFEYLMNLSMNDFVKGPEADRDSQSDELTILVFEKMIENDFACEKLYIKLKLEETPTSVKTIGSQPRGCVCLSFHKSRENN